MRCYCCGNRFPADQFRVYVGGQWVQIGLARPCIERAKVYAAERMRVQGRRLMRYAA